MARTLLRRVVALGEVQPHDPLHARGIEALQAARWSARCSDGRIATPRGPSMTRDTARAAASRDRDCIRRASASQPVSRSTMCGVTWPASVSMPSRRPPARERELAWLARVVRHGIRLHVDTADRQVAMRVQGVHAHEIRDRARGAGRHPQRRCVAARERRDALRVVGVLVRDEDARSRRAARGRPHANAPR